MIVIGLTGGIGTGKSTASAYLKDMGLAVIDADQIAREIVEPGQPLLAEIKDTFGQGILTQEGSLDRKALAAIVFQSKEMKERLDRLMHGAILEEISQRREILCKEGAHRGVVIDAPLLFETGLQKQCDVVWLLVADLEIRIGRVAARDHMTRQEILARVGSQMDDQEKRRLADRVIDNSASVKQLYAELEKLLREKGCIK